MLVKTWLLPPYSSSSWGCWRMKGGYGFIKRPPELKFNRDNVLRGQQQTLYDRPEMGNAEGMNYSRVEFPLTFRSATMGVEPHACALLLPSGRFVVPNEVGVWTMGFCCHISNVLCSHYMSCSWIHKVSRCSLLGKKKSILPQIRYFNFK